MASSSSVKHGPVPRNNVSVTPEAKNDDVVADPKLFMSSLENLHDLLGTKLIVSIIGGRDLDLHKLFVEVTSRSGIHKQQTHHLTCANTTSRYFIRTNGQIPPGSVVGSNVVGVIDGKVENDYLVTVTMGSQQLRGVLYQLLSQNTVAHRTPLQSHSVLPNTWINFANFQGVTGGVIKRRRRRKKTEIKRDYFSHPKRNRSGYTFFFAKQHARLKPLHHGKSKEISSIIGVLWNKLNEEEKSVYKRKAMEDKNRYQTEMKDYKEKLRTGQISNAVPLQQKLPELKVDMAEADLPVEEGDSSGCSGETEPLDNDQSGETDPELKEKSLHPSLLNRNPNLTEMVIASKEKTDDVVMETSLMTKADEQTVAMDAEQN